MLDDSAYAALCSSVTLQSNRKGFFQKIADDITECVGPKWLDGFGKLRSNKQRIVKCLTDTKVNNQVVGMMDNVQEIYRGKSATLSKQRRLEADHLFENGKTDKSLLMYTQSVIRAPVAGVDKTCDNGLSLALALWNRSAILYQQKKMRQCLDDIKLSIKEKLPDNLRLNAYWKMAECYISLKQFKEAKITLNILLQMTKQNDEDSIPLQWNENMRTKLNDLIAVVSKGQKNTDTDLAEDQKHSLTNGEHSQLRQVSRTLEVAETEKSGRFFIAAEPIRTGDTLVAEDAYVSSLSSEYFGSHCHHCLCRLDSAIPCSDCSAVAFCSLNCRTTAWNTYHKYECHYLDVLIGSGMSILCFAALRIVSQETVEYFANANLEDDEENSHPYMQVYRMVTHESKRSTDDFFRRTLMAMFLMAVLKKSGYFGKNRNVSDAGPKEILIGVVLLRNLEILQFNAHEISESFRIKDSTKTVNIGVGLYKSASYFNHECFPSVARYFEGTKLIVKAVRPVREHDIVGDSYGPVYSKFGKEDRQRKLRARYWFECECVACMQDWPLLDLQPNNYNLRCGACGTVSPAKKRMKCSKCKKSIEHEILLKNLEDLRSLLMIPVPDVTENLIQTICLSLDSLETSLCPPNGIYVEVANKLTQYWSYLTNKSV